jgi:hypothetical protein
MLLWPVKGLVFGGDLGDLLGETLLRRYTQSRVVGAEPVSTAWDLYFHCHADERNSARRCLRRRDDIPDVGAWCLSRWFGLASYSLAVEALTFLFTDIESSTVLLRRLGRRPVQ